MLPVTWIVWPTVQKKGIFVETVVLALAPQSTAVAESAAVGDVDGKLKYKHPESFRVDCIYCIRNYTLNILMSGTL